MRVSDPFIIENGGAVVIPAKYFPFFTGGETHGGDSTIAIGTPYQTLVENLRELQQEFTGLIIGFSDMSEKEVADDCGLTLDQARRAKRREFDEPFRLLHEDPETITRLMLAIRDRGLFCSQGGRYYHLHGHNDKGRAMRLLNHYFRQAKTDIFTVGLGDSLNDLPMLALADYPVLVRGIRRVGGQIAAASAPGRRRRAQRLATGRDGYSRPGGRRI
jgi:mannosyl-3-phosphoglycerate phosphatase